MLTPRADDDDAGRPPRRGMRPDPGDEPRAAGLDAALVAAVRDEVVACGVRKATASSIAARAGVHRVTLYRRGGGIRRLILDALEQVFRDLFTQVRAQAAGESGRERVADLCARCVTRLRVEPLVRALVDHDAELLLPYLVDRLGASQEILLAGLEPLVAAGIDDGSIRPGDPARMSLVLVQAATPFVVGRHVLHGLRPAEAGEEVRRLAAGYLRPLHQGEES